uniref:Attractin/MKLN-like beta-propeller domain-containing protein n=1 Tax=Araucaria cunninghamii TaxID=56994 RepID=A0A0D6R9A4_ARACU
MEKSNLYMEGDRVEYLHHQVQSLKRSVKRSMFAVATLAVVVVGLLIALIAVGASQGKSIKNLKHRPEIIKNPTVAFATGRKDNNVEGFTYGGSLFRGSGFWSTKASLPGKLTDHAVVGYNNDNVFIIGGAKEDGNVTNEVWMYDAVLHSYTMRTPMPEARYRFGAALVKDKIYVVGGRNISLDDNEAMVKSTFIYDIQANKWSRGKNSLEYHSDTCADSLDGKVYMIGGYGANYSYLNVAEVYDPVMDDWSSLPSMPTARGDHMCVAAAGEIYVLGGYYDDPQNSNNSFSDKMESYNPDSKKWTSRPSLLTPRGDAGIALLPGDKIMLIGGEGHYKNESDFKYPKHVNEVYYISDQTWVEKAMIPTARFRTAAAQVGGLAYVFGGADLCIDKSVCPALNTTEVYLDVDHPHVYIYLQNDPYYNDNAALSLYPF